MNKIKLIIRGGFDGQSPVTQAPTFRLVEGWSEAELAAPAGIFPAGLWGQVPAGDPYVLHASILTVAPITPQTFIEVQTGEPTQVRARYTPSADNMRLTLVRPSDMIRRRRGSSSSSCSSRASAASTSSARGCMNGLTRCPGRMSRAPVWRASPPTPACPRGSASST
jgi:hypothetical protein